MLSADVVVAELTGLFEGQLEHPLGPRCEGNFNGDEAGAPANDFFDFHTGILEVDPHGLEHFCRNAGPFTDQAQKDLLSSDEVVAEASGLLLGQHDHLDGLLGKTLEHR